MFKASPRVQIAAWDKAAVGAAQTPAATAFISLSTTYAKMKGGFATITTAPLPDWQLYDRGRVVFTRPTMGNADNTCVLELLAIDADDTQFSLGRSTLADGIFPDIEFDVTYEKYYVRVAAVGGTTAAVTVKAAVQGFYRSGLATS